MAFPVSARFVESAEQAIGRSLPKSLKARLMRFNGGEVEAAGDTWNIYPVRDHSNRKRLSRSMNDIVSETERAALWSNFPAGAVAIASNGAGDLLILLPSSDDLQFWDHETGSVSAVSVCWL